MSIKIGVHHRTAYRYDRKIHLGPQVVRLRPAPHTRTPVLSYSLSIKPAKHFLNWQQDPQSNFLARLTFPEPTDHFEVEIDLVADLEVINAFDFFLEPEAEKFPFEYPDDLTRQLEPYLETIETGPLFEEYLKRFDLEPRSTIDFLVQLNQKIQGDLEYLIRMEPGIQTPEETLQRSSGSCRDFAWLEVQVLRRLGLAARFASGYSIQLQPDVKPLEGAAGVAQDVVDLHAWTEVYLPGAGWVGMDPTSGLMATEGHIPVACAADPASASPISGALEECEVEFEHEMSVVRLREDPRSTRPYSEDVWERILEAGDEVEAKLQAADVKLTMGGEPTFVSIDDYVGDEWNTEALGEAKRELSEELIRRLRTRFSPGGLLHFGQGKWYPGEQLPRWSLNCHWRRDGEPVWRDERWLADASTPKTATAKDAEAFAQQLATTLGIEPEFAAPAYEDVAYYLWREGRLPVNVDPTDPKLDDPQERERVARIFDKGLGTPAGFVLPLERRSTPEGSMWQSGLWMLRGKHLVLTPGDSPVGLRLPMKSLPWVDPASLPPRFEPDPMAPARPLPPHARVQPTVHRVESPVVRQSANEQVAPEAGSDDPRDLVRTALSVEAREGLVHIFLPPVTSLEDYLALVTAVEDTAVRTKTAVVVEGYDPPRDPRLQSLRVTPDPGVIEVNIHPSSNWRELVEITTGLYEDARNTRLGQEKFLVDGRQVGTGGGNHIVVGGATPAESPFLRRPDLLRSLITYWTNHPSLSYLFSSMFLGPTSQAPRVDEARHDTLYELEIAFGQLGSSPAPWLVDRAFRHLLTDVTGNTHRSEFCIDKLFSPDSASGRQGLVEFRGFEMPPHGQMSLAQQLLIRALIARFWNDPYREPLVRWGNRLHDRFMLPDFVRRDLEGVLHELSEFGLDLDWEFFVPQFECRFPRVGTIEVAGMEVELRMALEPWHVLGEEPGGGGTVRFVDSSVERIQVRVSGSIDEQYVVVCNGRRVPLHPAGPDGVRVGGVRFRAWQPPHCLHPTIAPHAPLVFDVIDAWSGRSVGGCTYHVGHPGGRSYETPPVNSLEAESRRRARFSAVGHTPGPMQPQPEEAPNDMPMTLDLRRPGPRS